MDEKLKSKLKDFQCNIINEKIRGLNEITEEEKNKCYSLVNKLLKKEDNLTKIGQPKSIAGAVIWMCTDRTQKESAKIIGANHTSLKTTERKIVDIVGIETLEYRQDILDKRIKKG